MSLPGLAQKKKPRRLTGLLLTLATRALPTRNFWGYGQVLWGRRKTTANQAKSSRPKGKGRRPKPRPGTPDPNAG